MGNLFDLVSPLALILCLVIAFAGGIVKGTVGFALPMVVISGLSAFLRPELALAALILPTLLANSLQAFRQGWREAWASMGRFRVFLISGLIFLIISAQLVAILPVRWLFLLIGVPVVFFALLQLSGRKFHLAAQSARIEAAVGSFAGFIGGMSGVWGPPTVAYLTAIDTPKAEQMRVQGVIYGVGAVALTAAHVQSGVLSAQTVPLSLAMIPPAMLGMYVGLKIQDRIDQAAFRRATLFVLLIAGLNLVRRGLMG